MARSLDQIIQDKIGLNEMTIARLVWRVEDLTAKLDAAERELADMKAARATVTAFPRPDTAATG